MEIALESTIPTYSSGLGVLAGDTLRSAADARLAPEAYMISQYVTKAYFR
jgi:starch phosphorylase